MTENMHETHTRLDTKSDAERRPEAVDPAEVIERWPAEEPLAALVSAPDGSPWARWSVFGVVDGWLMVHESGLTYRRRGGRGSESGFRSAARGDDLLRAMRAAMERVAREDGPSRTVPPGLQCTGSPFGPGWIGGISYEMGRAIETAAMGERRPVRDRPWPLAAFARVRSLIVHDARTGAWRTTDSRAADAFDRIARKNRANELDSPSIGEIETGRSRPSHMAAVQAAREHIARGDIFQANITLRLSAAFRGSARRFAASSMRTARPRYGACIELPGGETVISLSPELFLQIDGLGGTVLTRPIKGTRPATENPATLAQSEKDAAELAMIVDLMRNDLGRVCEFGTVKVTNPRVLETHETVHHTAGEVRGALRTGLDVEDLLAAAFPPGSVTGAPKIRAMQIIDELETAAREWYCGSVGFLGDDGSARLNVAIRTAMLTPREAPDAHAGGARWGEIDGVLDYHVGGGIVADSDPAAEWDEAMTKSAALRAAVAVAGREHAGRVGEPGPSPAVMSG